jgi:hypothetical protein
MHLIAQPTGLSDLHHELKVAVEAAASDHDVNTTARLVDCQIRALINGDLIAAVVLHDAQEYWQESVDRSFGTFKTYIELGPWLWSTLALEGTVPLVQNKISVLSAATRDTVLRIGRLQMHLAVFKEAAARGVLQQWSSAALDLIVAHPQLQLLASSRQPDAPLHSQLLQVSCLFVSASNMLAEVLLRFTSHVHLRPTL